LGDDEGGGVGRVRGQQGNAGRTGADVLGEAEVAFRLGEDQHAGVPPVAARLGDGADVLVPGPSDGVREVEVAPYALAGVLAHVAAAQRHVTALDEDLAVEGLGHRRVEKFDAPRFRNSDGSHRVGSSR